MSVAPLTAGIQSGRRDGVAGLIERLRGVALAGLRRMFLAERGVFCFTVRKTAGGLAVEGESPRYTAITLIGLADEEPREVRAILGGQAAEDVLRGLAKRVTTAAGVGDLALTAWAAALWGLGERDALLEELEKRLEQARDIPTVELAWALSAFSTHAGSAHAAESTCRRLLAVYERESGFFRHGQAKRGARTHVACFADLVYPVEALAAYWRQMRDPAAREAGIDCVQAWSAAQGPAGQWWWHYDVRNGAVVEKYPVYSVHQDGMGPMALFAAEEAFGLNFSREIAASLRWVVNAAERGGESQVDDQENLIWRKVARREPRKLVRRLQAGLSGMHPGWRMPAVDRLFPPTQIDFECRPYHLGWLLYAFKRGRLARFSEGAA